MRVTDWNKITITAKEFLYGIVFAISMSGVYYKVYYQQSNDIETNTEFRKATEKSLSELKDQFQQYKKENDARFRMLEDDNLRRKILDESHSSNGYAPMERAK